MNQPTVWVERRGSGARLLPEGETVLPVDDRGFAFGDGLFETMRVTDGRIPLLDRHVARMADGLAFLGFPPTGLGAPDLADRCRQFITTEPTRDGYLKLTVSRGVGPRGYEPPADSEWLLVIEAGPWAPPAAYAGGMRCGIAPWRVDPANPTLRIKSLSGLEKVLARREAARLGLHELLFLNTRGFLTEGAATNLFLFADGRWQTPAVSCGLLPGVARAVVLDILAEEGQPALEAEITLEQLLAADEVILTNALMGIVPVVSTTAETTRTFPAPGPATGPLINAYQQFLQK